MMAESPIDGNIYYFVDKCLPFEAAISCAHFQAFSDAVAYIVKVRTKADNVNYLNDFLFMALLKAICNAHLDKFLEICQEINFPVSLEKTFCGATLMTFLGFLIDTIEQLVMIPSEKVEKAIKMIEDALHKKSGKITLHNLQRICGFLNFLGRCIVPGRAFNRCLYAYTANPKLKKHHHIRINGEMRRDLEMWLLFVKDQSIYAQGFMDFTTELTADVICMYSDASKAVNLGYGGICDESWMYRQWDPEFIIGQDPSIEYLELFALTATVLNWIHRFKNRRVILFCDNQSVVHMINNTSSSCRNCMVLIRKVVLKLLKENVHVFARYVRSKDNTAADLLSRLKIRQFKSFKKWENEPTVVPSELWPISKIWIKG